jgi:DNA-binding LytR/AlgR family response regulator
MPSPLLPVRSFRPHLASVERLESRFTEPRERDPDPDLSMANAAPSEVSPEPPASGPLPLEPFEPVSGGPRIAARRHRALVFLEPSEVWAFEADARLTFAHCAHGKLDIDVSLAEIEASPLGPAFVRVHRGWLVNLALVRALEHAPGETQLLVGTSLAPGFGIHVPVSRDRVRAVRAQLLVSTIGVRRRETSEDGRSF